MTNCHSRLRIVRPETPYLAEAIQILAASPEEASTASAETEAVAAQWSPPDPDLLREALAALRRLA